MKNRAKVTIAEVAKLAGVSTATAGRVLGKYGYSSAENREKVLAAAKKLEYRHNQLARSLIVGPRILPWHRQSMENLARYIIRASFSQERMNYDRESAEVVYRSRGGAKVRVFDAPEWQNITRITVPGPMIPWAIAIFF